MTNEEDIYCYDVYMGGPRNGKKCQASSKIYKIFIPDGTRKHVYCKRKLVVSVGEVSQAVEIWVYQGYEDDYKKWRFEHYAELMEKMRGEDDEQTEIDKPE